MYDGRVSKMAIYKNSGLINTDFLSGGEEKQCQKNREKHFLSFHTAGWDQPFPSRDGKGTDHYYESPLIYLLWLRNASNGEIARKGGKHHLKK